MSRDLTGGGPRGMGSYKTDFEAEENNDRFRGWTGAREARPATSFTTAQHQNITVKRERDDEDTVGHDMRDIPESNSPIATNPEERDKNIRPGNAVHDDNFISLTINDEEYRIWSGWSTGPPRKKRWTVDDLLRDDRAERRARKPQEVKSPAEQNAMPPSDANQPTLVKPEVKREESSGQPNMAPPKPKNRKTRRAEKRRVREEQEAKSHRDLKAMSQYVADAITLGKPELKQERSFFEQPKSSIKTEGEGGTKDYSPQLREGRLCRSPAPSPRREGSPAPPPWTLYQCPDQEMTQPTAQTISSIRRHERAQTILDALLALNQIGDRGGYDAMAAFALHDFGWTVHSRDKIIDRLKKELVMHERAANPRDRDRQDHRLNGQGNGSAGYRDDGQALESQGGREYRDDGRAKMEEANRMEFEYHGRVISVPFP